MAAKFAANSLRHSPPFRLASGQTGLPLVPLLPPFGLALVSSAFAANSLKKRILTLPPLGRPSSRPRWFLANLRQIRCRPSSPSLHPSSRPFSALVFREFAANSLESGFVANSLPALLPPLPPPTRPPLPPPPRWAGGQAEAVPESREFAADSLFWVPGQVNWLGWVPLLRTSAHRNFGSYFGTVTSQFSGEVADVAIIWAVIVKAPILPKGDLPR